MLMGLLAVAGLLHLRQCSVYSGVMLCCFQLQRGRRLRVSAVCLCNEVNLCNAHPKVCVGVCVCVL
jgi:hypothetical protein